MKFSSIFLDLCSSMGQTTLASRIGVDESTMSKFKNGQGMLSIQAIDKIFEVASIIPLPAERYVAEQQDHMIELRKREDTIATISEIWTKERTRNTRLTDAGNGSKMVKR